MKKLLLAFLISAFCFPSFCIPAWGQNVLNDFRGGDITFSNSPVHNDSAVLQSLISYGGLLFYKNFAALSTGTHVASDLNADFSQGDGTATFTSTRSAAAPATYVDDNGIIQLTTDSDVARVPGGYYDATGFHAQKGLMIEGSGTNYCIDGTFYNDTNSDGLANGWIVDKNTTGTATYSLSDIKSWMNVGATVNAQSLSYTGTSDTGKYYAIISTKQGTFAQNNVITVSFWIKGSISGANLYAVIYEYTAGDAFVTNTISSEITGYSSTDWTRVSRSITVSGATTAKLAPGIRINNIDTSDNISVQIAGLQLEANPRATSFVPTTTAALTRPAETLKYATAGNRNASVESLFVRLLPSYSGPGAGKYPPLISTEVKSRSLYVNGDNNRLGLQPNATDSAACQALGGSNATVANTLTTFAGVLKHSNPYARTYKDGSLIDSETVDDFTDPAWGTNFTIGSSSSFWTNSSMNSVTIYSTDQSSNVAAISTILSN